MVLESKPEVDFGTAKPLPEVQPWTQAFWDGTRQGKLLVQVCQTCQADLRPTKAVPPMLVLRAWLDGVDGPGSDLRLHHGVLDG